MPETIAASSALILCVFAIRKIFADRISPALRYGLWLLVLVRLVVPFSFPSPISVMNAAPGYSRGAGANGPQPPQSRAMPPTPANGRAMRPDRNGAQSARANGPSAIQTDPANILFMIWLCVFVAILARTTTNNIAFSRKIRREAVLLPNAGCRLPVYLMADLPSPCLFGIFRPKIVITPGAANQNLIQYVLAHELCHHRHKDNWALLLGNLCCAAYWFNPLVWIAARASQNDCEMACDERAIRHYGDNDRINYGKTLLSLACGKKENNFVLSAAASGRNTKRRIGMIAKRRKNLAATAALCLVLAAFAGAATFTGAVAETNGARDENVPNVVGKTAPEAIDLLQGAGFAVEQSNGKADGTQAR